MNTKNDLFDYFDQFLSEEDKITNDLLTKLSLEIVKCRLERQLTQKEFAKLLGVSQSMISKIESDEYNFSIGTLVKIFNKLDKIMDIKIYPKAEKTNVYKVKKEAKVKPKFNEFVEELTTYDLKDYKNQNTNYKYDTSFKINQSYITQQRINNTYS